MRIPGTLTPGGSLAALLVALAAGVRLQAAPEMADFEVWWKAASRAAQAEPLYRASDGHFVFKYLPAFAVLAIPIGLLPLAIAKGVWFFCSFALLAALVSMAVRLPVERRKTFRWLVIVTVVSFLKFYAHELVLGQVNIVFAVVATGALLAIKARRECWQECSSSSRPSSNPTRRAPVDRQAAAAVDCLGMRGPRPRPHPAGGACSWDSSISLHRDWWRTVTETIALIIELRQRIARRNVLRWFGPGQFSALARQWCDPSRGCRSSSSGGAACVGRVEGALPHADASAVAAGLGLRFPDCDAGDRVSGELPRSLPPDAGHHCCRGGNVAFVVFVCWAGRRTRIHAASFKAVFLRRHRRARHCHERSLM